jgi:hypothetical protein
MRFRCCGITPGPKTRRTAGCAPRLLLAPGWVRTDMGGAGARLSIEESIPNLLNTVESFTAAIHLVVAMGVVGETALAGGHHRQRAARADVVSLHLRLSGQQFDLLLVNAGVKNDDRETLADVSTERYTS